MTTLAALSSSDWVTIGLFAVAQLGALALMVFRLDKGFSLLAQKFEFMSKSLTKDIKDHEERIDGIEAHVFRRPPSKARNVLDTP